MLSPSGSNFRFPKGDGLIMGLRLLTKVFLVGLGLGLGVKVLDLIWACIDGEKHCLPTLVGDGAPTMLVGEVKICRDSLNDRGRRGVVSAIIGS